MSQIKCLGEPISNHAARDLRIRVNHLEAAARSAKAGWRLPVKERRGYVKLYPFAYHAGEETKSA